MHRPQALSVLFSGLGLVVWFGCTANPGAGGQPVPITPTGTLVIGGNDATTGGNGGEDQQPDDAAAEDMTTNGPAAPDDMDSNGSDEDVADEDEGLDDSEDLDGGDQDLGDGVQPALGGTPSVALFASPAAAFVGQVVTLTCVTTDTGGSAAFDYEFISSAGGAEIQQDGSLTATAFIPAGLLTSTTSVGRSTTPAPASSRPSPSSP